MEFKKILGYNINIEPTINGGFYVKIGRARFAFGDVEALIKTVRHYLENPGEYEKEFYKNKVEVCEDFDDCCPEPVRAPSISRTGLGYGQCESSA